MLSCVWSMELAGTGMTVSALGFGASALAVSRAAQGALARQRANAIGAGWRLAPRRRTAASVAPRAEMTGGCVRSRGVRRRVCAGRVP